LQTVKRTDCRSNRNFAEAAGVGAKTAFKEKLRLATVAPSTSRGSRRKGHNARFNFEQKSGAFRDLVGMALGAKRQWRIWVIGLKRVKQLLRLQHRINMQQFRGNRPVGKLNRVQSAERMQISDILDLHAVV